MGFRQFDTFCSVQQGTAYTGTCTIMHMCMLLLAMINTTQTIAMIIKKTTAMTSPTVLRSNSLLSSLVSQHLEVRHGVPIALHLLQACCTG